MTLKLHRGFTLIELLVVIAIISLLSSVLLTALNSARTKAREVAIVRGAQELKNVFELARAEQGTYSSMVGLTSGNENWYGNDSTPACTHCLSCSQILTHPSMTSAGNFRTNLAQICENIVTNSRLSDDSFVFHIRAPSPANNWSIRIHAAGSRYYCLGSNNKSSWQTGSFLGTSPGCVADPTL